MPNYRRPRHMIGFPVFFTVCLADWRSTALIDHLDILRGAVRVTMQDRPFEILAWVVLPNHMHAVWRLPESDPNYSQRWGRIKSRFSRDARRAGLAAPCDLVSGSGSGAVGVGSVGGGTSPALREARVIRGLGAPRKGETGIWQRRFWEHHCRDEHDLEAHIRYCWLNPVKHGYVEQPADWEASSIHRDIRLGRVEPEWCGVEPVGEFGEVA